MRHVQTTICATLAFLFAAGCGAGGDAPSAEGTDIQEAEGAASIGAAAELARIEFTDGNVVRFEELDGGVLVSELSSQLNSRRLKVRPGLTALEAFKTLAPGRPIPPALLRMHARMYGDGTTVDKQQSTVGAAGAIPAGEELRNDPDLEHNGEFQQAYPANNFLSVMCDFSLTGGSYKHTNRTAAHTDISLDVHSAYYAVGSDKGTITAQACVGKNTGGYFDGTCSSTTAVNAGYHASAYYDAGKGWICNSDKSICAPNRKRLELRYAKISTSVNFHECAQISATLTD